MLKTLILLTIIGPLKAQAELPSIFSEAFSPKVEAEVSLLNFAPGEDPDAPQGDFVFRKFKFVGDSTNVNLDNESRFYDSKIYYNGNIVGFQGPGASFVYRLREEDKNYFNTIKWINAENIYLLMDEGEISLRGEKLAQQGDEAFMFAGNFDLACDRHPDHLLNDGNGLLGGCLNFGVAKPIQGQGIGTEYHYYENGQKIVDFKGFLAGVVTDQESLNVDVISADVNFSDEVSISGVEVKATCEKPRDLMSVAVDQLVMPCLSNIEGEASVLDIKFLEDHDEMRVISPLLKSHGSNFDLKYEDVSFRTEDSSFKLSKGTLNCTTPEGDILEVETYMKGCLNDSTLTNSGEILNYEFKQKTEEPEPFNLTLNGKLTEVEFQNERLLLKSPITKLNIDDEVFLDFENIDWSCQKRKNVSQFDAKGLLDYCKRDLSISSSGIQIKDIEEVNQPIVAHVKLGNEPLMVQDGKVKITLASLKLADVEDLTMMKGVIAYCDLLENTDVFLPNDVIEACSIKSNIYIGNVYSEDSTFNANQLRSRDFNLNAVRIPESKPKVFSLYLRVGNGKVQGQVGVRFLGMNTGISFSGAIKWHKEEERLDIQIEDAKLPLGINSQKIFMFFLKKLLVAEMITYKKGGLIQISL